MDQVWPYDWVEPSGTACDGGDEHDPCVETLGYCPYCEPATPFPAQA